MTTGTTGSEGGWAEMSALSASVRLSLFYSAFFLVGGLMMPWWPVWLSHRGLDPTEIGLVLAVGFWIKPIANPIGTRWADRLGERRRPMVLLLAATAMVYALFGLADSIVLFALIAMTGQALLAPVLPLGDNLTMTASTERGIDYGRVRLWGSITFIAAASGAGLLLEGRSPEIILWLVVGGFVLTALVTTQVPDMRFPKPDGRQGHPFRLLWHPVFGIFLLTTGLNVAAHAVLYAFGTIHWQAQGLTETQIGWLWAEGVIAEIILFALSKRIIARTGPLPLLMLGCVSGVVRWTMFAFVDGFGWMVALQPLHAFTFGAVHLGAMHFIQRAAPAGLSASAQGLFSAFGMGIFMGLGSLAAGPLYEAFGGRAYLAMSVLSVGSTLAALVLARRFDGQRLSL
ncbi:MAG: major facilitator superfamily domain-containing protein 6 [Pseudomonadota bacterium]|nr:major facilitator superfamily domain-containing protein 6 [Pseudomonadota bacterium]